ncbi:MAG: hypothetical protein LBK47_09895 [Prevotellaceae bacterium]|jgi:hypothetical protein|nr:hypothetical protein [Prevotellaceae bacterium]
MKNTLNIAATRNENLPVFGMFNFTPPPQPLNFQTVTPERLFRGACCASAYPADVPHVSWFLPSFSKDVSELSGDVYSFSLYVSETSKYVSEFSVVERSSGIKHKYK